MVGETGFEPVTLSACKADALPAELFALTGNLVVVGETGFEPVTFGM